MTEVDRLRGAIEGAIDDLDQSNCLWDRCEDSDTPVYMLTCSKCWVTHMLRLVLAGREYGET